MLHLDRQGWDTLSKIGLTGHPGGLAATDRLARMCALKPDQSILAVGCGSGHGVCHLVLKWGVKAVAFDFAFGMVANTRKRAEKHNVGRQTKCLEADAQ
ncbi:MAG: methyltransferase domain-containing protein, partial [Nitrososphaera sp.]|nr:methyltransferase domain-containing protein [Nitrososphaera sp.]